MRHVRWAAVALLGVLLGSVALAADDEDHDRGALWHVVRGCVAMRATTGLAFPCEDVRPPTGSDPGFAILKSPRYPTELLVTPAEKIAGIESAASRAPAAAGLWQVAWDARTRVAARLGHALPASVVGLVVNSKGSRTQDELHIHVDCLAADVQRDLAEYGPSAVTGWGRFPRPLRGDHYWIKAISGPDLGTTNVLADVVAGVPAGAVLGKVSIAVASAALTTGAGFYLLMNVDDKPAESLLDHSCR